MATKEKGGSTKKATRAVPPAQNAASSKTAAAKVAPAKGKLGVMVVGLGAVATTMIAGVEAVRRGLAKPIGSLTQMGTIRLGKRTDNKSPLIKDFVPLANLNDIVFTGWDIFEDNVYEAAAHAAVLDKPETLAQLKPYLETIKPHARRLRPATTSSGSTARTSRRARTSAISPNRSSPTFAPSRRRSIAWS